MGFLGRLRKWSVAVDMGEAMKYLRACAKQLQLWFVSKEGLSVRWGMYGVFVFAFLALVYISYQFGIDVHIDNLESWPFFVVGIFLFIVAILVLYACTHFIVFTVTLIIALARQRKRKKMQAREKENDQSLGGNNDGAS
jgi:hypothetical protein